MALFACACLRDHGSDVARGLSVKARYLLIGDQPIIQPTSQPIKKTACMSLLDKVICMLSQRLF